VNYSRPASKSTFANLKSAAAGIHVSATQPTPHN
jgi:hypothetical protein